MRKSKKLIVIAAVLIASSAIGVVVYFSRNSSLEQDQPASTQSKHAYTIKLESGTDYPNLEDSKLAFRIEDEQGQVLKSFNEVHGQSTHLVVVRKDRVSIVYLEPAYDDSSGRFTVSKASFPSDGEYRVFVEFLPADAQTGPDGQKLSVVTYQDITVGDANSYRPQQITRERFESSDGEFDLNVFLAPHDPSDPGLAAGSTSSFAVSVYKNGQPFTALEQNEGSRVSMVMFGPNLEYVHAHANNDEVPDTYVLSFSVIFPTNGLYTAFLRTKADGKVNITDYVLSVSKSPESATPEDMPMEGGH